MDFKNKIILVTGAASGIGRAAALAFAREGGTVIATDINDAALRETVRLGADAGAKLTAKAMDIAKFDQVEQVINDIVGEHGRLDVAVNNAGIGGVLARSGDVELADWDQMLAINTTGTFYCMRQELRQMQAQKTGGSIVNVASVAGLRALANSMPYTAAKHAVVGMTKAAAVEYARKNIRVNALCPAFTVTQMFQPDVMNSQFDGLGEKLKHTMPMRRFADVEEQISALLWLASDRASFVTGMAMAIDGGLTA